MLNLYNFLIFEDDMAFFRKKMVWELMGSELNKCDNVKGKKFAFRKNRPYSVLFQHYHVFIFLAHSTSYLILAILYVSYPSYSV
jgi:hypothetical protein